MIQVDKEISIRIEKLNNDLNFVKMKTFFFNILYKSLFIVAIIYIVVISKGLSCYIQNITFLTISVIASFILVILVCCCCETNIQNILVQLSEEETSLENKIEKIKDFSVYLTACRHLESINNGNNQYPELRYNDSVWIVNEYKDIFEEKRIEYEKKHQKGENK